MANSPLLAAVDSCGEIDTLEMVNAFRSVTHAQRQQAWMQKLSLGSGVTRPTTSDRQDQEFSDSRLFDTVANDVGRVCRTKSAEYQSVVTRVLWSFWASASDHEFCQGMVYVASALYHVLGDEDAAGIAFTAFMDASHFGGLFQGSQPLLQKCMSELTASLELYAPALLEHLTQHAVDPGMVSCGWFQSFFLTALPQATALDFMDFIVCRGAESLVPLATALLLSCQSRLLKLDCNGVRSFLKSVQSGTEVIDIDAVLATALSLSSGKGLEFTVTIDHSDGSLYGFTTATGDECLDVIRVQPCGSIPEWNSEHPDRNIQKGDMITSVNGITVAVDMDDELDKPGPMRIKLQRRQQEGSESRSEQSAVEGLGMQHLCAAATSLHSHISGSLHTRMSGYFSG